jgi:mono/diheme cytochrome c family protein
MIGKWIPALAVLLSVLQSGTKTRSVWDGVYTTTQASRGEASYTANCGGCHQPTLAGRGEAPSLKGDAFMERWHDYNLKPLFDLIKAEMPPLRFRTKDTHQLDDATYTDVIAFMLQVNGFPAGNTELTQDSLEKVQILGKNGAQPPPNYSLVLSVGCMVLRKSGWVLDNATDPVRATNPNDPTPEEIQAARTKLLGIRQYRVVDFGYLGADFEPDYYAGHKIQVKGYLIRQPEFERISVTSLADIAARCQ